MMQTHLPEWPALALGALLVLSSMTIFCLTLMDERFGKEDWNRQDGVDFMDGDGPVMHTDVLCIYFQNDTDTYHFQFDPDRGDQMCCVVTSMAADSSIAFSWRDAAAVNQQIRDASDQYRLGAMDPL